MRACTRAHTQAMDVDNSGTLTSKEFCDFMKKLASEQSSGSEWQIRRAREERGGSGSLDVERVREH